MEILSTALMALGLFSLGVNDEVKAELRIPLQLLATFAFLLWTLQALDYIIWLYLA